MHTREVTYTDSKGHTHTRTEIYWTWDGVKREEDSTETFSFMGVSFPADKFSVSTHRQGSMIYDNSELRHYYVVADASMVGSIHTRIKDHMIVDDNEFYADTEAQAVVDRAVKNAGVLVVVFWVFWIVLTCGAVYGFCALENRWLDG